MVTDKRTDIQDEPAKMGMSSEEARALAAAHQRLDTLDRDHAVLEKAVELTQQFQEKRLESAERRLDAFQRAAEEFRVNFSAHMTKEELHQQTVAEALGELATQGGHIAKLKGDRNKIYGMGIFIAVFVPVAVGVVTLVLK